MATYIPPKRSVQFIFYISLRSQVNPNLFQANPTLAAGDVKVSIDGGAEANITTLPVVTPAGGRRVKVTLSVAEMAADQTQVTFVDVSGAEWCDVTINIPTVVTQFDDFQVAPANFSAMSIDASGRVDVGKVSGTAQTAGNLAALVVALNNLSSAQAQTAAEAAISAFDPAVPGAAMALTASERNAVADALAARSLGVESYAADGTAPTFAQALFMLISMAGQFSISGTTITCKKLDGTTTSMTFTLDSAITPTSRTRTT